MPLESELLIEVFCQQCMGDGAAKELRQGN